MNNVLTNGARITIVETNEQFHTIDDLGLAIGNNNYIGQPQQQTTFISIQGKNGLLDLSEAITGHPTYSSRQIKISFGGIREPEKWDSVVSALRNKIEGRIIKITFDNDPYYYWTGRCHIEAFDRMRSLGTFELTIPNAEPFKYTVQTFNEDWLWDPFSFENGITTEYKTHTVNGHLEITLPKGTMPVVPVIEVISKTSRLTVRKNDSGRYIDLKEGNNELPQIMVNGNEEVIMIFDGNGEISINFRGASL